MTSVAVTYKSSAELLNNFNVLNLLQKKPLSLVIAMVIKHSMSAYVLTADKPHRWLQLLKFVQ